eukprot:scaffold40235_cov38-Attheya_sp.AAC.1
MLLSFVFAHMWINNGRPCAHGNDGQFVGLGQQDSSASSSLKPVKAVPSEIEVETLNHQDSKLNEEETTTTNNNSSAVQKPTTFFKPLTSMVHLATLLIPHLSRLIFVFGNKKPVVVLYGRHGRIAPCPKTQCTATFGRTFHRNMFAAWVLAKAWRNHWAICSFKMEAVSTIFSYEQQQQHNYECEVGKNGWRCPGSPPL